MTGFSTSDVLKSDTIGDGLQESISTTSTSVSAALRNDELELEVSFVSSISL